MQEILKLIDEATDPAQMNLGQALEWLEQLSTEIAMRMDAIKDDLRASMDAHHDE